MIDWATVLDRDDARSDIRDFLGRWNLIGLIFILGVSIFLLKTRGITSNTILAILTAVYVLTSFNEMREVRKTTNKNPIQPDFEYDEKRGIEVPVLRNFDTDPALSFELLAVFDSDNGTHEVRRIEKFDKPHNLLGGDTIRIMDDCLEEFLQNHTSEEIDDDAEIRLYYAFTMLNRSRSPSGESNLLEKDLGELQEAYPNPKSLNLSKVYGRVISSKESSTTENPIV